MDGYATFRQLLTAPADAVFRERRPLGGPVRLDGVEHRAFHRARPGRKFSRMTPGRAAGEDRPARGAEPRGRSDAGTPRRLSAMVPGGRPRSQQKGKGDVNGCPSSPQRPAENPGSPSTGRPCIPNPSPLMSPFRYLCPGCHRLGDTPGRCAECTHEYERERRRRRGPLSSLQRTARRNGATAEEPSFLEARAVTPASGFREKE
jgi:hypothetical protein